MNYDIDLLSILRSLQSITGLGICIYDNSRILTRAFTGEYHDFLGHYCRFCKNVRYLENGRESCNLSDRTNVVQTAQTYDSPFFNVCHMGLTEYIIPVKQSGRLVCTVFLGQCNIIGETDFDVIAKNVKKHHGNPEEFREYFDELPKVSRLDLMNAGIILSVCIEKIVDEHGADLISTLSSQMADSLVTKAIQYIKNNYMLPITSIDVANSLHVSLEHLSRVFKKSTGKTILQYITSIRIYHAKHLLHESDVPLQSISYNVGYNDQNYFSRIFKKETGLSPLKYRKMFENNSNEQ